MTTQLVGLPISDEHRTSDGKMRQDFERASFIYDAGAVAGWQFYFAPVGKELREARDQVTQTASALATATQLASLDAGSGQAFGSAFASALATGALSES